MNHLRMYLKSLGRNAAERATALSAMTGVPVSAATIKRLMTPDPAKLPRQIRQVYTAEILDKLRLDAQDYHNR